MKSIAIKKYLPAAALLVFVLVSVLVTTPGGHAAQGGYTTYVPGLYGSFAVAVVPDPGFYMLDDFYRYTAEGTALSTTTTTFQADIYAFFFDQRGLMGGLGLQGTKITKVSK